MAETELYPGLTPTPEASPSQPAIEAPFEVIRLDDILSVVDVQKRKEADDAATLATIGTPDMVGIRNRLVEWATNGFQGQCSLFPVVIVPPERCSDGVTRSLADYIQFVSGLTIYEHLALLQLRLPDFVVSFVYRVGNVIEFQAARG